jgi:hypothetical protein
MNQLLSKQNKQDSIKNPQHHFGHSPAFSKSLVHPYLQAQGIIGNHGILRHHGSNIIQAKLKIGQPNDKYEQEADRITDQVMRMAEPKESLNNGHSSLVQRKSKCSECEEKEEEKHIQTKPLAEQITPLVQRQVDEEEEPVQAKQAFNQTPSVSSNIESGINSLRDGGKPLPESTRSFFESRFGTDFSQVRVYADSNADGIAKSVNAKAFTIGKDVVFGAGEYSPGTSIGKSLLAHELTHVIQQSRETNPNIVQCELRPSSQARRSGTPRRVRCRDEYVCISGHWRQSDNFTTFSRRVLLRYIRREFDRLSPDVENQVVRNAIRGGEQYIQHPQPGRRFRHFLELSPYLIEMMRRIAGTRSGETADDSEATEESSVEETAETLPPQIRDFYQGSSAVEGERIPTEELISMYRIWTRFVEGHLEFGDSGHSFRDWVAVLRENQERLRGQFATSPTGQLEVAMFNQLLSQLEEGQIIELQDAEEQELIRQLQGEQELTETTGPPEWLLIPVEDRRMLLQLIEAHPELFSRPENGEEQLRRLTFDVRRSMALRMSVEHMPESIRDALLQMVTSADFWLQLGVFIGIYYASHYFGVGEVITASLLLYVGYELIEQFFNAWQNLNNRIRDAESVEDMEAAAQQFAAETGSAVAQILVLLAMFMLGSAVRRPISRMRSSTRPPTPRIGTPATEPTTPTPETLQPPATGSTPPRPLTLDWRTTIFLGRYLLAHGRGITESGIESRGFGGGPSGRLTSSQVVAEAPVSYAEMLGDPSSPGRALGTPTPRAPVAEVAPQAPEVAPQAPLIEAASQSPAVAPQAPSAGLASPGAAGLLAGLSLSQEGTVLDPSTRVTVNPGRTIYYPPGTRFHGHTATGWTDMTLEEAQAAGIRATRLQRSRGVTSAPAIAETATQASAVAPEAPVTAASSTTSQLTTDELHEIVASVVDNPAERQAMLDALSTRARQIHRAYSRREFDQTVAVYRFLTQEGEFVDVIAASGSGLESQQRTLLEVGEEVAEVLVGSHAEIEGMIHGLAVERGYTPVGVSVTWNFCPQCERFLTETWLEESWGGVWETVGRRSAFWRPN